MKSIFSFFVCLGIFYSLNGFAIQTVSAQETPTPEAATAPETTSETPDAPPAAPPETPTPLAKEMSALAKEIESLKQYPIVKEGLAILKEFKRRLPNHYRSLELSKKQTNQIYDLQREYFNVIAPLQARIERLEKERDEAIYQILTDEQKADLQKKLDESKKTTDKDEE